MGLDMYLYADMYIGFGSDELKSAVQAVCLLNGIELEPKSIQFEVAYWRKANAIHSWFVEEVQEGKDDCGSYYVSAEKLEELKKQVELEIAKKPSTLEPTTGFFFGSTEKDQWYYDSLEDTIEMIDSALAFAAKHNCDLQYHSSW